MEKIRNIAIIAHVDHGKTTLVDQLLRQSGTFRANQKVEERMMDSMDLERENARPHEVLDLVFDLFVELKATNEQLDFPIIYASAKEGFAKRNLTDTNHNMTPLFETIVQAVPPPKTSPEPFFQMLVSNLDYSDYLGRIALGRIVSGRVRVGDSIV